MKSTDIPVKIPIPFASAAGAGFVTNPIPETTSTPGQASMEAGFPPVTFEPPGSGGIPPDGRNMNGILLMATAWSKWQAAGAPIFFDADYAANLTPTPGYPYGAIVLSIYTIGWWISLADDNTSNPDTPPFGNNGTDWYLIPFVQGGLGAPLPGNSFTGIASLNNGSPPNTYYQYDAGYWWQCTQSSTVTGTTMNQDAVLTPMTHAVQINPSVTGATYQYVLADLGQARIRSNGGAAMADTLPTPGSLPTSTPNGWWTIIKNGDATAALVVSAPTGKNLDGVLNGSITLNPDQTAWIGCDVSGEYWVLVPPVPATLNAQAVYVNSSGTYGPGVYDIDTTGGPIVFTLKATPTLGDNYHIRDVGGVFATNNCSFNPGTNTIEGFPGSLAADINWIDFVFTFKSNNWSQV